MSQRSSYDKASNYGQSQILSETYWFCRVILTADDLSTSAFVILKDLVVTEPIY